MSVDSLAQRGGEDHLFATLYAQPATKVAEEEAEDEDLLEFMNAEDRLTDVESNLNEASRLLVEYDGQFTEAFSDIEALEAKVNEVFVLRGQVEILSKQLVWLCYGLGVSAALWLSTVANMAHK